MRVNREVRGGSFNAFLTEALVNKPPGTKKSVVFGWNFDKDEFEYPQNWKDEIKKFNDKVPQNTFDKMLDSLKTTAYYDPQPKSFVKVLLAILLIIGSFIALMIFFKEFMIKFVWITIPLSFLFIGCIIYCLARSYKRSEIRYLKRREKKFNRIIRGSESRFFHPFGFSIVCGKYGAWIEVRTDKSEFNGLSKSGSSSSTALVNRTGKPAKMANNANKRLF
jgi:hypothetical protein